MTGKASGVSMFRRVVPIYLLEKMLYRGTISESQRRQRAIMHIQAGSETWTPINTELQGLVALFQQADLDPTGAIVATRNDVNVGEVRCLSGSTIISTDKGLIRIEDMVKHNPKELKAGQEFDTDLLVKNGHGKFARVSSWIYQGKKPTMTLTTQKLSVY